MSGVLHSYGVLATDHVEVTSGLELTGQYIGETKKKVKEKMEAARGGVLFVDEAYSLGDGGKYEQEAVTTLLQLLTEPEYSNGKTVVILAGYEQDMNRMLNKNPGLKSRFSETVRFGDWQGERCYTEVKRLLEKSKPIGNIGEKKRELGGIMKMN